MRRFLYYNQDSIYSFLAQIEQGLILKEQSGEEQVESVSSTQLTQEDVTGDLSAKVLGIGASLRGDIKNSDSDTDIATQMVRSIQEKALHDYAFEKVYEYISFHNMINNENPSIGNIVSENKLPTFLDFNYFQALFSDNGAVKFSNEQAKKQLTENIAEIKQSVPKGTQLPEPIKLQIKAIEDKVKNAEPERKDMVKTIETIRNTLPYSRFIMTDRWLIPLEDKNFRDDPDIIAFKYGGNMSILGYVTNIIDSEEVTVCDNDFAPLYDTVNKVMLSLFKNKQRVFIVHPIALYY